jgi:hypothetical protein
MKVTGPRPPQAPSSTRKSARAGSGGQGFAVESGTSSHGSSSSSALSGTTAINSVDALLAVQAAGDFTEARKRATERAFSLLDVLDDLKIALLEGGIPRSKLTVLIDTLKTRRDSVDDPRLEAMLDEVETRAAVELAKHDA